MTLETIVSLVANHPPAPPKPPQLLADVDGADIWEKNSGLSCPTVLVKASDICWVLDSVVGVPFGIEATFIVSPAATVRLCDESEQVADEVVIMQEQYVGFPALEAQEVPPSAVCEPFL